MTTLLHCVCFADYREENVQFYVDKLPDIIKLQNPINYVHFSDKTAIKSFYSIN